MLAALRVRALLVLACVILIPYERTCIEVLAALQALLAGAWLFVTGACCCLLHYRPCLLVLGCLLPVLACVILIPYERTCIEVLAALQALLAGAWLFVTGACLCLLHYGFVPCSCLVV